MDSYNLDLEFNDENPARSEDDDIDIETNSQSDESNSILGILNKVFVESSSEAVPRAWARTLTAGCWGENQHYIENFDPATRESHYRAYYHFMRRLKELQATGTEGEFSHDEDSARFERTFHSICWQRRVFWTENMTFGLGPQCMQPSDIVVVLFGGNTPYILRPKGDKYLFMGQAYVDNIMHGETFSGSEDYEERGFCLI